MWFVSRILPNKRMERDAENCRRFALAVPAPLILGVKCRKIIMEIERRKTNKAELDEVIEYWLQCPRASSYLIEDSLIKFLEIFTPHQIKGAMYLATCTGRKAYFKYMCGVLHNWRKDLEQGKEPRYFDIGDNK